MAQAVAPLLRPVLVGVPLLLPAAPKTRVSGAAAALAVVFAARNYAPRAVSLPKECERACAPDSAAEIASTDSWWRRGPAVVGEVFADTAVGEALAGSQPDPESPGDPKREPDAASPAFPGGTGSVRHRALRVLSWNVLKANRRTQRARELLSTCPADVVCLQEVRGKWLQRGPDLDRAYPHRLVEARRGGTGMALLSVYPVLDHGTVLTATEGPRGAHAQWARLGHPSGDITVVNLHPRSPRWTPGRRRRLRLEASTLAPTASFGARLMRRAWRALRFDPAVRDELLGAVMDFVDLRMAAGERLLVVGDFNLTARELPYFELAERLVDVAVSLATAKPTWGRGRRGQGLPPLLRIDYQWAGPGVVGCRLVADSRLRGSDHRALLGCYVLSEGS